MKKLIVLVDVSKEKLDFCLKSQNDFNVFLYVLCA